MCSDKNTLLLGIRQLSSPLIYCPHHTTLLSTIQPTVPTIPTTHCFQLVDWRKEARQATATSTDGDTARSSTAPATTSTTSTTPTTSATTSTVAARLRRHLQQFPSITPPTVPFNHASNSSLQSRFEVCSFGFWFQIWSCWLSEIKHLLIDFHLVFILNGSSISRVLLWLKVLFFFNQIVL